MVTNWIVVWTALVSAAVGVGGCVAVQLIAGKQQARARNEAAENEQGIWRRSRQESALVGFIEVYSKYQFEWIGEVTAEADKQWPDELRMALARVELVCSTQTSSCASNAGWLEYRRTALGETGSANPSDAYRAFLSSARSDLAIDAEWQT